MATRPSFLCTCVMFLPPTPGSVDLKSPRWITGPMGQPESFQLMLRRNCSSQCEHSSSIHRPAGVLHLFSLDFWGPYNSHTYVNLLVFCSSRPVYTELPALPSEGHLYIQKGPVAKISIGNKGSWLGVPRLSKEMEMGVVFGLALILI